MSSPRTYACRALRVAAPLAVSLCAAAVAFAAEESGAHQGGGVHIPWGEIVKQAINFLILAGVLVYFLRKPLSSFLKERSELLRKAIDDAAKARAEAAEKLAAIEARTANLADEIAGMNAKMDVEAAAEARRLQETVAVRDLPDPRPVGVHRRTGSEKGPRGAAPGGVPPYGPGRRGARPQDLVARGPGAAGP